MLEWFVCCDVYVDLVCWEVMCVGELVVLSIYEYWMLFVLMEW